VEKLYTKEIKLVGLRVKKLRESEGITQQTLADLCEVDIRTIQRIERGDFGFSLHILFALAEAFNIKAGDLLIG
jgi:transcriptional regulator with XRE-family HTH domain